MPISDKDFSFIVLERTRGRRSDTFGGFRKTASGSGWQFALVTDWVALGRVGTGAVRLLAFCANGGRDPRKGSGEDAVFVTSGRDTPGVLNLRRAWGEAEAGIQSAQVIQVLGEILWRFA